LSAKVSTNETDTNKADAKEMKMRRTMLALFGLLSASAAMIAGAGPAAAFDYPYCIQGKDWGIPGDCSYVSMQSCVAAASGRGLYCAVNPRVALGRPLEPRWHHRDRYSDYDYNGFYND
jgi:Protein of unknown function (DUF3551)